MLYPPNILFFGLLPFKAAYNYSVVAHFILAGFSTYIFSRKIGQDEWGALIASILFCFGSVFAGCFINIASLKALSWFPLFLFMFEKYLDDKNIGRIFLMGVIAGMQFLAGSFQMAFYSIVFYLIYFVSRSKWSMGNLLLLSRNFIYIISIAFLIALPQFIATHQLAAFSSRPDFTV
ncbi:unnamed protein product, partial [marine sediment metagenome]